VSSPGSPKHFVFGVADIEAEHFAFTGGGDAGGDDDGVSAR
jgi:hypothetical protein